MGYDGIVIAVSKQIYDAGVTSLTKDQVKKIYSGEINNWKDLGGPDDQKYWSWPGSRAPAPETPSMKISWTIRRPRLLA